MIRKLSPKEFLETFKFVPRVAVDLVIKNKAGEILLTKRAIHPFKNYWHIPGSFLIKGEKLSEGLKRVAKKEMRIKIDPRKAFLLGVFENLDKDERGHIIDVIYGLNINKNLELTTTSESAEIKFFANLPQKIGFNHKDYLIYISKN